MSKQIDLAKKIAKDLDKDWSDLFWDYNMPQSFSQLYAHYPKSTANKIACFIIFAYSHDSMWLDLNKDRRDNKIQIAERIGCDINEEVFANVIDGKDEVTNIVIFDFLETLKTWKWRAIFDLLEYAARISLFATKETEAEKTFRKQTKDGDVNEFSQNIDIDVIAKVEKEKGLLLDQAHAKRIKADALIKEIQTEFVNTDMASKSDFGFAFTDTSKKINKLSWRDFINERNEKKKRPK